MRTSINALMVRGLSALAMLSLACVIGLAQSDNTQLSGFVKDQAGAVVANAGFRGSGLFWMT